MLHIRVPATSANLGPGFDCLGIALSLYLEVTATPSNQDHFFYTGQGHIADTPDNLMHEGFRAAYLSLHQTAPTITFNVINPIPLARGLGSSSAALVAGIAVANTMMNNQLGREGVFQLAAEMEGHPDNVAPAIYGGFTASVKRDDGSYLCERLELPAWTFLFAVPTFEVLTSEARAVLPDRYSRANVIFNASRTALWTLAVALNKGELLRVASQDAIHERFREKLVPGLAETRHKSLEAGAYGAFLSGAGPTVGVICSHEVKETCKKILQAFVKDGHVLELQASEGYGIAA
jgi:homoserine kinase